MQRILLSLLVVVFLFGCQHKQNNTSSVYQSKNDLSFHIQFGQDSKTESFLQDSAIVGSGAKVSLARVDNQSALEVKTAQEFSDAFLDLEKLLGREIDFSKARYLKLKLLVPKASWITALKFNFKDARGNFGGCDEIVNNFYGNYDQWVTYVVDLQHHIPLFKNWHGEDNPLPQTKYLSLNPYNAHQADSSSIYIHSLELSQEYPSGEFEVPLTQRPEISPNLPYTITFDEEVLLRKQMAIRAFESTYQAMAKNVGGNKTMAIRLKGKDSNKHLAFLPILDKLTGDPVDFTKVKTLKFSYYLTEDSADFDGSILYLANEHWKDVLVHKNIYDDFKKGVWQEVRIDLSSLNLDTMEGSEEVLPNVYEIRFGLNYRPNQKNIEMWLDNFGWE